MFRHESDQFHWLRRQQLAKIELFSATCWRTSVKDKIPDLFVGPCWLQTFLPEYGGPECHQVLQTHTV